MSLPHAVPSHDVLHVALYGRREQNMVYHRLIPPHRDVGASLNVSIPLEAMEVMSSMSVELVLLVLGPA